MWRRWSDWGRALAELGECIPGSYKLRRMRSGGQLADLERELREYETLRAGGYGLEELSVVDELATVLIKARIGQGLSQKELAERIGVKEQQQSSATRRPTTQQRALLESKRWRVRWGRRANAPLAGRGKTTGGARRVCRP